MCLVGSKYVSVYNRLVASSSLKAIFDKENTEESTQRKFDQNKNLRNWYTLSLWDKQSLAIVDNS